MILLQFELRIHVGATSRENEGAEESEKCEESRSGVWWERGVGLWWR